MLINITSISFNPTAAAAALKMKLSETFIMDNIHFKNHYGIKRFLLLKYENMMARMYNIFQMTLLVKKTFKMLG